MDRINNDQHPEIRASFVPAQTPERLKTAKIAPQKGQGNEGLLGLEMLRSEDVCIHITLNSMLKYL